MGRDAQEKAERVRRKTHLPRDSPGFIRTQWLENFYETLYASNEPGFYIPYTVVFQYRRIYAAYFSDSDGCVQKVDKIADLGPEQVLEGLKDMRHGDLGVKRSDIVYTIPCRAYYIYSKRIEESFAGEGKTNLSIEYLDDSAVTHFLTYRGKENNGILQQVQELTTPNVSTIRAYWTPHYCQLESRINVNRSDANNVPLAERAVTFEGELHHSSSFPLSSRLESRIRDLLERIVFNVRKCLPNNLAINLMILNFRVGPNGKVFFLYCNSLKLQYSDHYAMSDLPDVDNLRPPSPKFVDNDIPPPGFRGSKKRFGRVCPSTNNRLGPYDDFKVTVQDIFIHFLWHGPREAWKRLGRDVPSIPLENGSDPGVDGTILRFFLTMDLRPVPFGRPFLWNAGFDKASAKEENYRYWSDATKDKHKEIEAYIENKLLENPKLKAAYRYWEATMVWLISQEVDFLSQENFQQERIRPPFLNQGIHACTAAMLAYNSTREEILDGERKQLLRPIPWEFGELAITTTCRIASRVMAAEIKKAVMAKDDVQRPMSSKTKSGKLHLRLPESAGSRMHVQEDENSLTAAKSMRESTARLLSHRSQTSAAQSILTTPRSFVSSRMARNFLRSAQRAISTSTSASSAFSNQLPSVVVDNKLLAQLIEQTTKLNS